MGQILTPASHTHSLVRLRLQIFFERSLVKAKFLIIIGTTVIITGTNQFSNPSGVTNPSWKCSVDGVSVPSANVTAPENRLLFCEKNGLSDGPHVITVDVTVSNEQTFWFDYIQYLPSASMSLNQVSLSIDANDSQIQYGTGWSPIFPGNMTGQTGSTFSFNFNGDFYKIYAIYHLSLCYCQAYLLYGLVSILTVCLPLPHQQRMQLMASLLSHLS